MLMEHKLHGTRLQSEVALLTRVREVFVVCMMHVWWYSLGSSTDNIRNRQARITLTVECTRTCIVILFFDVSYTRTSRIQTNALFFFGRSGKSGGGRPSGNVVEGNRAV